MSYTPLQLTTVNSLLTEAVLKPLPAALIQAINSFNATTVISKYLAAVNAYKAQSYFTQSTFDSLLSIGSTVCPALGNSIPESPIGTYTYLTDEYLTYNPNPDDSTFDPSGFSNLVEQTGSAYLGNGDNGKFTQGFMAVYNYTQTVNNVIKTAVNADNYLGPTFKSMDSLTTADITGVNPVFDRFGTDLAKQGNLVDTKKMDLYGTPAGLLQQVSRLAGISKGAAPPMVANALVSVGLTPVDISNLVNDNRAGLNKPNGLSQNEFDKLQKSAYEAMTTVGGDNLQQVLDILDVTTPNVNSMEDLLNPLVMFPLSYDTMLTTTPEGPVFIFGTNGSVNSSIAPIVNSYLPTASGCDELGKIIPPAQAVANKAIQVSLQNIPDLPNVSWPDLAKAVFECGADPAWDPTQTYLPNDMVADYTNGVPQCYQAQQDVPPGTPLNDTDFWEPIAEGNLLTMEDLPLIQDQTTAVDPAVTQSIADNVATGTGCYETITMCDVIGLATDHNDFAAQFNTATTAINALQAAGSLATLNTAYDNIVTAVNDAAVITQIANANAAISALSASPYVTTLNTAWTYMANLLNKEVGYQVKAGFDYFTLVPGENLSMYAFVQSLPLFAKDTCECGAWDILTRLFNTDTLGGQAAIGSIREAYNQARLAEIGIQDPANQIPPGPQPGGDFVDCRPKASLFNSYPKTRAEVSDEVVNRLRIA